MNLKMWWTDGEALVVAETVVEANTLLAEHFDGRSQVPVVKGDPLPDSEELDGWLEWDQERQGYGYAKPTPTVAQVLSKLSGPAVFDGDGEPDFFDEDD